MPCKGAVFSAFQGCDSTCADSVQPSITAKRVIDAGPPPCRCQTLPLRSVKRTCMLKLQYQQREVIYLKPRSRYWARKVWSTSQAPSTLETIKLGDWYVFTCKCVFDVSLKCFPIILLMLASNKISSCGGRSAKPLPMCLLPHVYYRFCSCFWNLFLF